MTQQIHRERMAFSTNASGEGEWPLVSPYKQKLIQNGAEAGIWKTNNSTTLSYTEDGGWSYKRCEDIMAAISQIWQDINL